MPQPSEPRLLETVALGLIQGPAELLPVSSTAHVELLPWMLGWQHARLEGARRKEVAVALHAGTAIALAARTRRLRIPLLVAATAPPALAGLALEEPIERRLGTPRAIAAGLVAGSVALVVADGLPGGASRTAAEARVADGLPGASRAAAEARVADGLWLGAAQACALAPGVSRSGATRAMARARGFSAPAAIELSAELALPVLAGATALKAVRLAQRRPSARTAVALAAGTLASVVSTAAVLRVERRVALPGAAWAAYRTALAAVVLRMRHNRTR